MWINLKNPWSSSRHMLSKLVGDPRAKSSGRLDTITFASPGFDPVTGVMLLQDSSLAAICIESDRPSLWMPVRPPSHSQEN